MVLIQMMPGTDGTPWALCVAHYNEGRTPFKVGLIPTAYKADAEADEAPKRRKTG